MKNKNNQKLEIAKKNRLDLLNKDLKKREE